MNEIENFLNSKLRNRWIQYQYMKVYVRKAVRQCGETFDVATVEVEDEERGKHIFTNWLTTVEELLKNSSLSIYVENVMEERFRRFFEARGYVNIGPKHIHCYVKTSGRRNSA